MNEWTEALTLFTESADTITVTLKGEVIVLETMVGEDGDPVRIPLTRDEADALAEKIQDLVQR